MINTKEISNKIFEEEFTNFLKSSIHHKIYSNTFGNNTIPQMNLFHVYQNTIVKNDMLLYCGNSDEENFLFFLVLTKTEGSINCFLTQSKNECKFNSCLYINGAKYKDLGLNKNLLQTFIHSINH